MSHWCVSYWLKLDNWNIWDWDREWEGKSSLPWDSNVDMNANKEYSELINSYTLKKLTKKTSKYEVNSLINDEYIYLWKVWGEYIYNGGYGSGGRRSKIPAYKIDKTTKDVDGFLKTLSWYNRQSEIRDFFNNK